MNKAPQTHVPFPNRRFRVESEQQIASKYHMMDTRKVTLCLCAPVSSNLKPATNRLCEVTPNFNIEPRIGPPASFDERATSVKLGLVHLDLV